MLCVFLKRIKYLKNNTQKNILQYLFFYKYICFNRFWFDCPSASHLDPVPVGSNPAQTWSEFRVLVLRIKDIKKVLVLLLVLSTLLGFQLSMFCWYFAFRKHTFFSIRVWHNSKSSKLVIYYIFCNIWILFQLNVV